VLIPSAMKKIKTPRFNILTVIFLIWKHYKTIFLDHEALKNKGFGRPRTNPRKIYRAIMHILWSGGSWRSLPRGMGKRSTIHGYFLEWAEAGLFKTLWEQIAIDAAKLGLIDPSLQMIDGTHILTVYMPNELSGFSYKHKNKRAVKISILIDSQGIPVSIDIDSANIHDSQMLGETLGQSVVEPVEPRQKTLLGDSGYIGEAQENTAEDFGFTPNFRPTKNQIEDYPKNKLKENKKNRWMVERSISWIKNMRRIRTCYEKSIKVFRAFCQLSCAYVVFRRCFT
jgi:transposase